VCAQDEHAREEVWDNIPKI